MRRLKGRAGLFVAFVVPMLVSTRLWAFCLEPKIRVDDEYFVSDLVFTGTIVADEKIGLTPDGFFDGQDFTWRVDRVFRGPVHPGELVHTYSGNDSGRFPFETKVGGRFLILASPYSDQKGEFAVDSCGNSAPLSRAASTIAEIRQLPRHHGGLIYGKMIDGDEGVRITAVADRSYSTVSGPNGEFSMSVRPGTYAVTVTKAGHTYADFDLAYKNSSAVKVPEGGSAGVAFREKGR